MKRIVSLILTVVLALSLCACGGSGGGTDQELQVGFDRQSVTPTETGAPIAGGDSSSRPSDGFLDEVCVTCIALSKGGETYLVFTCDYMIIYDKVLDSVKTVISGETGTGLGVAVGTGGQYGAAVITGVAVGHTGPEVRRNWVII